ncbi:protein-tyrosine-phosphatase [Rhodocytophaga aerolata]|uniref:Protein-tyrosine-phosphatase n=1 Tax=Rhodocytophaga aerolata TaxID=455078 RepID=A0ABT8R0A9_9BACT|nr:protein-tyrosine-phosphatase [Rhodocytophaga aerolata]MDO1445514.1 protein-tyrosine-phosphatase [Rhodocytophaga aerolata]
MKTPIVPASLYNPIQSYISSVTKEFDQIPEERKELLTELSEYIQAKTQENKRVKLTFICTHNSRRSHISQIWAQTAAYYYGLQGVETYSGGTEATAFNPRAVKAMAKVGFQINKSGEEKNPIYQVKFTDAKMPVKAFSKVYDGEGNPKKDFAAIMTCSQADEACPFIPGADTRIAIPYDDPKEFDGTSQEEAKYDERTRQIAREVFYAFSLIKR